MHSAWMPALGNRGSSQDVNLKLAWLNQDTSKASGKGSDTPQLGITFSHFAIVTQESRCTNHRTNPLRPFPSCVLWKKLAIKTLFPESRKRLVILIWASDSVKLSWKIKYRSITTIMFVYPVLVYVAFAHTLWYFFWTTICKLDGNFDRKCKFLWLTRVPEYETKKHNGACNWAFRLSNLNFYCLWC